jgi:uncharacterized membrane protein YkvA (DUF1232 family)
MRIELQASNDDPSWAPLREARQQAAQRHRGAHAALAQRARAHHQSLDTRLLSSAVCEPLTLVPAMASLLEDPHWQASSDAREQIAGALGYFVDPDDLIPDEGNRFGYLDDALVLKLTVADVRHEWFAWCDYRDYVAAHPDDTGIDRETWLLKRRERFDSELRRRNDGGYAASGRRERGFSDSYAPGVEARSRFGVR